jgi:acetylornithine deacetylase/succinyl-diaminopimelate desuccinylase family protein
MSGRIKPISLAEEKVLAKIDEEGLIKLAQRLIQIETINPPADYSVIAPYLYDNLNALRMETHILEGHPGKKNVFGLWRGTSQEKVLLLSGHTDVVPAGEKAGWSHDPFRAEVHDGWLWGRGTVDMKGAISAQIFGAKAVIDSKSPLSSSFMLGFTVDDETAGSWGMKYAIEKGLPSIGWPKPTAHVLGEANGLNLSTSFKGRLWCRVSTKGKAAHGGEPDLGINAIDQMIKLIDRFQSVPHLKHPLMGKDTLNLGILQGGQKVNIVPDSCTVHIDLRMCAPGSAESYENSLRKRVEEMKKEDSRFEVSEFEVYERRDPIEMAQDHPLIDVMKECIRSVTRKEPQFLGTLSAGDLYHTMKNGIPGTWIGPGSAQFLHQANERIRVDELIEAARIYALLILRLCG